MMLPLRPVLVTTGADDVVLSAPWDVLASESSTQGEAGAPSEKNGEKLASNELEHYHDTVLLQEAVHFMTPGPDKVLVDGTLGGGGHTELMLENGAKVYGVDQDAEAREYAQRRLARFGDKFQAVPGNFADVVTLLPELGEEKVDGILVDIGVSSRQFDAAERGFSFSKDGPLDMRMNPDEGLTAAEIVNTWSEAELARIFWQYGEERASRKIARHICSERKLKPFTRTTELAQGIEKVMPRMGKKIHPATKVFQALRIEVNDELGVLRRLLDTAKDVLKPGGRLVVISFHSLEDRMVKRHFKSVSQKEIDKPEWPGPKPNPEYAFDLLTRKPVVASATEVKRNPRSRSAVLRAAVRV